MKRTLALILSVLLAAAAVLPVLAEDHVPPADAPPAQSQQPDAAPTAPGGSAETGEEAEAADDGTAAPDAALTASSVQNAERKVENTADSIPFDMLRGTLMQFNPNIQSLKAKLMDLNGTNTDDVWDAISALGRIQGSVNGALAALGDGPAEDNLIPVYNALTAALTAEQLSLEMQISSMKSQWDTLHDSVETGKNSYNNAIDQILKGAEDLYINIVAMEDMLGAMQRSLDTLDRAVAITEKQLELGMASDYDVESMRHQRSQAQSQYEALQFQIVSLKITLEGMCNMELNGSVSLGALPMPTQEELNAVNYDKMLSTVMGQNVDVDNAELAFDMDSSPANRYARINAQDTVAAKFKVICLTVPEDTRLAQTAQEAVDFQQRTFDIAAKKYEMGMVSHEDYLSAQSDLDSAKDNLITAQRDLFSAYRAYFWATKYGVV